jgi:hypothetical protein
MQLKSMRFDSWQWPFVWVITIPVATVPITYLLMVSRISLCTSAGGFEVRYYECPTSVMIPTLVPGILNLVPFVWLRSAKPQVWTAGLIAGMLGLVRFLSPLAQYNLEGINGVIPATVLPILGSVTVGGPTMNGILWLLSWIAFMAYGPILHRWWPADEQSSGQ